MAAEKWASACLLYDGSVPNNISGNNETITNRWAKPNKGSKWQKMGISVSSFV
jgi:hypothetical protein